MKLASDHIKFFSLQTKEVEEEWEEASCAVEEIERLGGIFIKTCSFKSPCQKVLLIYNWNKGNFHLTATTINVLIIDILTKGENISWKLMPSTCVLPLTTGITLYFFYAPISLVLNFVYPFATKMA